MEALELAHNGIEKLFREILPVNGMAVRESQIKLCHQMLDNMQQGRLALCDAGVGIGKTIAYLAAGAIYKEHIAALPILISTSGTTLQRAIVEEHAPLLSGLMAGAGILQEPFSCVMRKGKARYVCDERLAHRLKYANLQKKNEKNKDALLSLKETIDMDSVAHLSSFDRRQVCVPERCECKLPICRYKQFVAQSADSAHIFQICNHNYLIADLMHRMEGKTPLLPDYSAIIIDEAHKLRDAAAQMFEKKLYPDDITSLFREILACRAARRSSKVMALLRGAEQYWKDFRNAGENTVLLDMAKLTGPLHMMIRAVALPPYLTNRIESILDTLSFFKEGNTEYDIRLTFRQDGPHFTAKPFDISDALESLLWQFPIPIILTSGSLSIGEDFSRLRTDLGIADNAVRVTESVSLSPFNYHENCLLFMPKEALAPHTETPQYYDNMAILIQELLNTTYGHALVLFTSYTAMHAIYERLSQSISYPVFLLWRNAPQVLQDFRTSGNGILFAAGSAWEGMDFSGDIVSLLVIVRLPFPKPEAWHKRKEMLYPDRARFIRNIIVPEMQMKLKQGFGRAIRTETDSCVVAILDARALPGEPYHEDVLKALPPLCLTDDMNEVEDFIRRIKPAKYFLGGLKDDKCSK